MKNVARNLINGWVYMQTAETLPGDLIVSAEEFDALCEERAEILFSKVVYRA